MGQLPEKMGKSQCKEQWEGQLASTLINKQEIEKKGELEWAEQREQHEAYCWKCGNKWDLIKRIFYIQYSKGFEIQYITIDGQIMRTEQVENINQKPFILMNWDQIQYMEWQGQYDNNIKKNGKWAVTWEDEVLEGVGGEYNDGKKQGKWKELFKNYHKYSEVFVVGVYLNDMRVGEWKYFQKDKEIGGGYYNEQGQKKGKWIELGDNFWDYGQVIYHGEYKNSKKVGIWDIFYRDNYSKRIVQIGGGSYMQIDECKKGGNQKQGKWIELGDRFFKYSQVTYNGEYKNRKKVGRWDIFYRMENDQSFEMIGGGTYVEIEDFKDGENQKDGKWIELSDEFKDWSQITYAGEYKNGRKIGRWDIFYKYYDYQYDIYGHDDGQGFWKNQQIGGGSYIEIAGCKDGENQKDGKWIELSDEFKDWNQILYIGEYKNGTKIGRWDNLSRKDYNESFEKIGGGLYVEIERYQASGNQKNGRWIETNNGFYLFGENNVIQIGEYNYGKKVGRWDIFYGAEQIGGGSYVEVEECKYGNQKHGIWIELSEGFYHQSQVTYKGEYKSGKKVGRWDIFYKFSNKFEKIGGGSYVEMEGFNNRINYKEGKWIELDEEFYYNNQVIYNGEYQKGKKVGKWDVKERSYQHMKEGFKKKRETFYKKEGNALLWK